MSGWHKHSHLLTIYLCDIKADFGSQAKNQNHFLGKPSSNYFTTKTAVELFGLVYLQKKTTWKTYQKKLYFYFYRFFSLLKKKKQRNKGHKPMGWFETLALKEYSKFPLTNESNPPNPIYHFLIYTSYSLLSRWPANYLCRTWWSVMSLDYCML